MAEKSVKNLILSIENSKKCNFERILFGIGIRYVGETVAKKLAKHFKNIDAICDADFETLLETEEIGEKTAFSVQQYFSNEKNLKHLERLKTKGLNFILEKKERSTTILNEKIIVVSGTFNSFSRDELKELIEINGGINSSAISIKTRFLIAGNNVGPAKLKQSTSLGIEVISEDEFIKLISS
jgi:DNA ligase (NAD+)